MNNIECLNPKMQRIIFKYIPTIREFARKLETVTVNPLEFTINLGGGSKAEFKINSQSIDGINTYDIDFNCD